MAGWGQRMLRAGQVGRSHACGFQGYIAATLYVAVGRQFLDQKGPDLINMVLTQREMTYGRNMRGVQNPPP
jgi:hypothetical protein